MRTRSWIDVRILDEPPPYSISSGETIAVDGLNFSGRTNLLRGLAGVEAGTPDGSPAVYVGPEIYNSISGLCATVTGELTLGAPWSRAQVGLEILAEVGLGQLADRNPFLLSGGEQACVAIAAATALGAKQLCFDGAFEQIGIDIREPLLLAVKKRMTAGATAVCDNHFEDLNPRLFTAVVLLKSYASTFHLNPKALTNPEMAVLVPDRPATLTVSNLSFRYGEVPVLRDLSFELDPGRVYLLEGRNGAGKSTLAKLLCGVLKPERGTISIEGFPEAPWRRPGLAVGYHFQNPDVQLFSQSVREEIVPHGVSRPTDMIRMLKLIFGFDEEILEAHPQELPFVSRKRVALAATIAGRRPWLILDEPTLAQDENATDSIAKLILTLAERGTGIIVISHSQSFKRLLNATTLLLSDGTLAIHPVTM